MTIKARKHLSVVVSGKVQGVYFRASAKQQALDLSLFGFVRNLPDGRVELQAEGHETNLNRLLQWCYTGPQNAKVTHVDFEWSDSLNNYDAFDILL